MKEKNDCKIVQDLLPNYIEKLTSKETNAYIEEHINGCKECQKILDAMQKDIQLQEKKLEKKKVKYIKKYNHKLRILKTILLSIILIFIVLFVAFPGRNTVIIESLEDKFEVYEQQANNVYIKALEYDDSNLQLTYENYYKDNMTKYVLTNLEADIKVTQYVYPNEIKEFIEEPEGKRLNIEPRKNAELPALMNYFYNDSLIGTFFMSMDYKITTSDVNGRECYVFSRTYAKPETKIDIYIEKDTGLVLQSAQIGPTEEDIALTQYEYSFGTVTDEDMQEPDATEYRLTEDN